MRTITFIMVATMCFSCDNKCKTDFSHSDPCWPVFTISVIDSEGNDLFFGENGIYDPRDVVFVPAGGRGYLQYWMPYSGDCFALIPSASIFYVEFIPKRIDTIRIEKHFAGYAEYNACLSYEVYNYNVFLNNILVLNDIDYCGGTLKIELK